MRNAIRAALLLAVFFVARLVSAAPTNGIVRIHDHVVFEIDAARGGHTAVERAQHASSVLEHAAEDPSVAAVRLENGQDFTVVYVGDTPVVQLGPDDAVAAGDASLQVHAQVVATKITDALKAERKRSALATTVFSISLLVFSALMAFLAVGKLGELIARAREWILHKRADIPGIRVAGVDVVRPGALRGVAVVAVDGAKWLLRLGIAYAWILFALSLFEATRPYSERLTGFVVAPLYGLVARIGGAMPVLFIFAVAALALLLLLRFVALFFEGVARGDTELAWLPADLAPPTSALLRLGILVVAASLATPVLTGSDDGPLARASLVALGAIGVALVPLLATAAVGATLVFGRRFKTGEFVEIGPRHGIVRAVHLLFVALEDDAGCELRVPHLLALTHAVRLLGPLPPVTATVGVPPGAPLEAVTDRLARAAEKVGVRGKVELAELDASGATYRVTILSSAPSAKSDLLFALGRALEEGGFLSRPVPARTGAPATHDAGAG